MPSAYPQLLRGAGCARPGALQCVGSWGITGVSSCRHKEGAVPSCKGVSVRLGGESSQPQEALESAPFLLLFFFMSFGCGVWISGYFL